MVSQDLEVEGQGVSNHKRHLDAEIPSWVKLAWLEEDHAELASVEHKELLLGDILLLEEVAGLEVWRPNWTVLVSGVVFIGAQEYLGPQLVVRKRVAFTWS